MDNPFLNNNQESNDVEIKENIKTGDLSYEVLLKNLNENSEINKCKVREITSILGVTDVSKDKEGFKNYLNFIEGLENLEKEGKVYWLPDGVKNGGNTELVNQMNRYWLTINKIKNVTENEIIKFTYFNHPSNIKNLELKRNIEKELSFLLKEALKRDNNLDRIKNYYLKLLMWIEDIVPELEGNNKTLKNFVLEGSIKRDTSDFLNILRNVGIEILYINVEKEEMVVRNKNLIAYVKSRTIENELVGKGKVSLERLNKKLEAIEKEESSKVKTVARQASEEIDLILHGDGSGLIKPWQFENYDVHVTQLKTTYDEVLLLWEQPANMRSGFKVEKGLVSVPSFFVKISGIPEDVEKYWVDYDTFISSNNTKLIKSLPFMKDLGEGLSRPISYNKNGFEKEDVKNILGYKYGYLRESIQDLIIDRMNEIIEDESLLKLKVKGNSRNYKILDVCMNIPEEFLNMLQKFDFAQEIPKIVFYLNGRENLNDSEAIIVTLLNIIGFDIVVLTPTGYTNIENIISSEIYETHRLYTNEINLEIPVITEGVKKVERSFWDKLFKG